MIDWPRILANYLLFQFRQPDSEHVFGGTTACTHNILQLLTIGLLAKVLSLDEISVKSGYPFQPYTIDAYGRRVPRGMRPAEVRRYVSAMGLPFALGERSWAQVLEAVVERGPVGFGCAYSEWPEWRGFTYKGTTADGRPNGFAIEHGKTQLTGFTGAHFGLFTWKGRTNSIGARDPNHNSAARPEKPAWDVMSLDQAKRLYLSYNRRLGRTLYALYPLERIK